MRQLEPQSTLMSPNTSLATWMVPNRQLHTRKTVRVRESRTTRVRDGHLATSTTIHGPAASEDPRPCRQAQNRHGVNPAGARSPGADDTDTTDPAQSVAHMTDALCGKGLPERFGLLQECKAREGQTRSCCCFIDAEACVIHCWWWLPIRMCLVRRMTRALYNR